jgi:DNA-binding MarR family transcriptional regulator
MTSRLDRLSGRGFVTRRPDPADGRIVRVRLTVDGRRHVDDAFAALLSSERELLSVLDRPERTALADSLRALLLAITAESDRADS